MLETIWKLTNHIHNVSVFVSLDHTDGQYWYGWQCQNMEMKMATPHQTRRRAINQALHHLDLYLNKVEVGGR